MRPLIFPVVIWLATLVPAAAQDAADAELIGELMAFHGSQAIVSAMTTHCYETTGLDQAYKTTDFLTSRNEAAYMARLLRVYAGEPA